MTKRGEIRPFCSTATTGDGRAGSPLPAARAMVAVRKDRRARIDAPQDPPPSASPRFFQLLLRWDRNKVEAVNSRRNFIQACLLCPAMLPATLVIFFMGWSPLCNGAELTNRIPSDEVRYNEAYPKMIWGDATNFLRGRLQLNGGSFQTVLRCGILVSNGIIVLAGQPLEAVNLAQFCIEDYQGPLFITPSSYDHGDAFIIVDKTNAVDGFLPPFYERFEMAMTNADGVPVPKTAEGRRFDRPVSLKPDSEWSPSSRNGYRRCTLFPRGIIRMSFSDNPQNTDGDYHLDPAKYFKITKRGLYKLTIAQRICITDTNIYLRAITLPPVTVPVRVED